MQRGWVWLVHYDSLCLTGAPGSCQQPRRGKPSSLPPPRALPKFTLISATVFRGAARPTVRGKDAKAALCHCFASASCQANRGMSIECEQGACDNRALQRRDFLPTMVCPIPGEQDQWGLFTREAGQAGDRLEEFVGEGLTPEDFTTRLNSMEQSSKWYFCVLAHGVILDASLMGSYARFVNHSCEPNAALKPWLVNGYRRLCLELTTDVPPLTEITFSYDYQEGDLPQPCWCGTPSCTGTIWRLPAGLLPSLTVSPMPASLVEEETVLASWMSPAPASPSLSQAPHEP